jgi:hypothetical protein
MLILNGFLLTKLQALYMRQTLLMGFVLKHIDLFDFGKNIRCTTAKYESRLEKVEVRLDKVELRLDKVEADLAVIMGQVAVIDKRLAVLETKFDNLEEKFDSIEKKFDTLLAFLMKTPMPIQ